MKMANPVFVDCLKGVWTKVAEDITTGQIHKANEEPFSYLHTYRTSGDPPPTGGFEEGIIIFINNGFSETISFSFGIDLYIFCVKDNGRVRIDL